MVITIVVIISIAVLALAHIISSSILRHNHDKLEAELKARTLKSDIRNIKN